MKKDKEYDIQELFHNLLLSNPKSLEDNLEKALDIIVDHSEKQKGVLAVIVTGIIYKHCHPEQDVRKHQANMAGGYYGRSFDTKWIPPFLKANRFPAMSESGWLTRSLEQAMPYDKNYLGKISGIGLKKSLIVAYMVLAQTIPNDGQCHMMDRPLVIHYILAAIITALPALILIYSRKKK